MAYPAGVQGWFRQWEVPRRTSGGSLLERVALNREISPEQIRRMAEMSFVDLSPPEALPGAVDVARLLVRAIRDGRKVAIYGDYDADGMCASAILAHVFRGIRGDFVPVVHIPTRATDPYGLWEPALVQLAKSGVQTIVTVDCGITAVREALIARDLGMELLITDHHAFNHGGELPQAAAICHPQIGGGCELPCGAAVAWKVAWAVAREWCGSDRVTKLLRELLVETLSLAALGTVADVVPLVGENRLIVRLGSERIARSGLPGLRALARQGGISPTDRVDAERISFSLAPILNACGRLGGAVDAVDLLALPSIHEAGHNHAELANRAGMAASEFAALNAKRKEIEKGIVDGAMTRIDEGMADARGACVLADEQWPRGVVGIACARLVEILGVPVALLERDGEWAYGSVRSVEGYSALDGLHACSHLLERYGGHAAAAGLTVRCQRIEEFRRAFSSHAAANRPSGDLQRLRPDAHLLGEELTLDHFQSLAQLGPFGRGFPPPSVLISSARVCGEPRCFGSDESHLSFHVKLQEDGSQVRCTWWRKASVIRRLPRGTLLHLVARPTVDNWRGEARPVLIIQDAAEALEA